MKKNPLPFLVCAAFVLMLSGCKKEEIKTVSWYEAHHAERESMIKKCNDNPGELRETPNCENASKAQSNRAFGSNKGLSG